MSRAGVLHDHGRRGAAPIVPTQFALVDRHSDDWSSERRRRRGWEVPKETYRNARPAPVAASLIANHDARKAGDGSLKGEQPKLGVVGAAFVKARELIRQSSRLDAVV